MTSGGLAAVSSSAFAALYSAFGRYDVVHIHAEGPAFFAWLPKMFGKRVVTMARKSSSYGAALEYLIFKHDELRKTPILDQNGNRIMRDEFYLDGLNCEPYALNSYEEK